MTPTMIWLDLDDTLWDFKGNSRIALRRLWLEYNLATVFTTPEAWIEAYEEINHSLWARYNHGEIDKKHLMDERFKQPLVNAGHPRALELGRLFDPLYLDFLAECTGLVEGTIDLLRNLKSNGFRTGILSNGFKEVQHRKIHNSGLGPYIDYILLSDDICITKPDRRIYDYACKVAGVTPGECMMVGDNPDTDIAGALNAGWQAIYFNPDLHTNDNNVPATIPCPHITELREVIDILQYLS